MRFKTLRQRRYARLRNAGFVEFEAVPLSKIPTNVPPYMNSIITEREKLLKRAKKKKWTYKKYTQVIKAMYDGKGWAIRTLTGKMKNESAWAMLRDYENRYKDKHPDYTSPWLPRQKRWRDFQSRFDRGETKYPKGRHYR